MSPKAKNDITLPSSSRKVTVDGIAFDVDFDDVEMLRHMMQVNERLRTLSEEHESKGPEAVLTALIELADEIRGAVCRMLGADAYDKLFGAESEPLLRAAILVTQLASIAGEAYEALFAGIVPKAETD